MSDMTISGVEGTVSIKPPPETPKLPPREWLKENLFSSPFNGFLTIVSTATLLMIGRGLLSFIFNPERQWGSTSTNLRLMMTQAYPEEQYMRVWVCVGIIFTLVGLSMAIWNTGSRITLRRLGSFLLSTGVVIDVLTLLAPFSSQAKMIWLIIGSAVIATGGALLRTDEKNQDVSTLTLMVATLTAAILALWVVPFGHHSFVFDRTPRSLAETGTVALTTKLPWTIMLLIGVLAYFSGKTLTTRFPSKNLRPTIIGIWFLAPPTLLYLILRDPDFDMGHVLNTDLPIFLIFAVIGGILLTWFTRPTTGEIGRVGAALILLAGFGMFFTPMRMIIRILMLLLAIFALAAPTFAGDTKTRRRYAVAWVGLSGIVTWLVTAVNTPSTIEVPGDFFIGGVSLTLMVAIFTIVISFPIGILLALARTSKMPIFRILSTWFIEFVRGIPLITILIFFSIMVPMFLPRGMELSEVSAIIIGYSLFSAAYLAENVRGGLQSVTRGQHEAAEAVGMTTSQKTFFIVLPQALRVSIPPLVGHCIGVFKETSLLAIIGLFDVLYIARNVIPNQTEFLGSTRENLLFVSLIYFFFAYQMSKASQRLEQRVGLGER
ncbi:MAG TPA: amino acid ABC transporter permease [Acidimicrobiales bacterium]|nr:amino acid ABC transporter permease [Acidimicrobiales bacterium]